MKKQKRISLLLAAVMAITGPAWGGQAQAAQESVKTETVKTGASELSGEGVKVIYDEADGTVQLYLETDGVYTAMSRKSYISYPILEDGALEDFASFSCEVEEETTGAAGSGSRMTVTSVSESTGLKRICVIETVDDAPGVLYIETSYEAGGSEVEVDSYMDCVFELDSPTDIVWSYNGGGEGQQSYYDTLQKIDLQDSTVFYRENLQDQTAAGIPAADIYSEQGGITVGDASAVRRELSTPVEEMDDTVRTGIKRPGETLYPYASADAGEGFVCVHESDYYMGLRGYANAMETLGFSTLSAEEIPESSYELRWESWGWEFDWTMELIIDKLDELQAMGITQITLDDGWYNNAGEWGLSSEKFPNGESDIKQLVEEIHAHGMTAVLWWRPCDGGRESSALYQEHPEYFVKNEDGSFGKLAGPGSWNTFNGTTGYALCPMSEGALQSQVDFVKKAIGEWGFDGLKSDYVWSMPNCYNPEHNHESPSESTENQALFYEAIYNAIKECNPDGFHLLCNCGTPQDFYSLPYVTQIPTADPTSVDQTRRRVKAYKALCGDYFPVTTDHNEVWYPSTIGTGAVLIEKRNFTGEDQEEYEKWVKIAQEEELHKGNFVGGLYSYGFDAYETYVVEKDGTMYYAFYRDGQYQPDGSPDIELKGLDSDKLYRIVDYVNDEVVATNLRGCDAVFEADFSEYLLVKAIPLDEPDEAEVSGRETAYLESLVGLAESYEPAEFEEGQAWDTYLEKLSEAKTILENESASQSELNRAEEALLDAMLALRRTGEADWDALTALLPVTAQTGELNFRLLFKTITYAKGLDVQSCVAAVKAEFEAALDGALEVYADSDATQEEADAAYARLLYIIQYTGYLAADKTELSSLLGEYGALDLAQYENTEEFERALAAAQQILEDENAMEEDVANASEALRNAREKLVAKAQETETPATGQQSTATATKLSAPAVKSVKTVPKKSGIQVQVKFDAVANASSYAVYRTISGKETLAGATTGTTFMDDSLYAGKKVSYSVVAVSGDTAKYTDSDKGTAKTITVAKSTSKLKATVKSGRVTLTWKKVKNAKSYVIYVSTKKSSGYRKLATVKKNKLTYVYKKAKKGKTCYFRIAAKTGSGYTAMKTSNKAKVK